MNGPARHKALSVLALATALIVAGFLPQSAHGMYDPKHGRWLQRDPIGVRPDDRRGSVRVRRQHHDGASLYQYVRSRPDYAPDPNGMCAYQPDPPAPPPSAAKRACDRLTDPKNWRDGAKCLYQRLVSRWVKDFPDRIDKCKPPEVVCRCCDSGVGYTRASSRYWAFRGQSFVTICYETGGSSNSADLMQQTLLHELSHVWQNCVDFGRDQRNCYWAMHAEIQAHHCDGTCNNWARLADPDTGTRFTSYDDCLLGMAMAAVFLKPIDSCYGDPKRAAMDGAKALADSTSKDCSHLSGTGADCDRSKYPFTDSQLPMPWTGWVPRDTKFRCTIENGAYW
jgi:hypothetical protein